MAAPAFMAFQGLSSILSGLTDQSGYKKQSNFDKNQKNIYGQMNQQANQLGAQGGGYENAMGLLQDYLNPQSDVYKNFEAPYMQQFEQQTIPGIAEKFAGMGAMGGGLSSSGFGQALGAAGANLQTDLASMKSQMQRQSIGDILGQYNKLTSGIMGAQPFTQEAQGPGTLSSIFGGLGGMSNPFGAFTGGGNKQKSGSISFG